MTHIQLGRITVALHGTELFVLDGDIRSEVTLTHVNLTHSQSLALGALLMSMEKEPPVLVTEGKGE